LGKRHRGREKRGREKPANIYFFIGGRGGGCGFGVRLGRLNSKSENRDDENHRGRKPTSTGMGMMEDPFSCKNGGSSKPLFIPNKTKKNSKTIGSNKGVIASKGVRGKK